MPHLAAFAGLVSGHGTIVHPPSRFNGTWANGGSCVTAGNPILPNQPCSSPAFMNKKPPPGCVPGGSCLWFSQGCTIGCDKCGDSDGKATCANQGKPTLPKEFRTWHTGSPFPSPSFSCKVNPWCAPGSAPVMDPCGVTGGGTDPGQQGNGGVPPDFYSQGMKGSSVPFGAGTAHAQPVTKWAAGSTQEVAWAITANHGGGYQYRLCPRGEATSEACFQKLPLEFANTDTQWIQYRADTNNRTAIPAMTLSEGTVPAGSQWRRNPIPACGTPFSGGAQKTPCVSFQFTPPGDDLARPGEKLGGFGAGACDSGNKGAECSAAEYQDHMFAWSIVDQVKVPAGLKGDYVIGFRYDAEQTPQVWAGCSDITIE